MKQTAPVGYVPGITYKRLWAIIDQLDRCGYQGEAGPLRLNTFFIELKRLANYGTAASADPVGGENGGTDRPA